MTSGQTVLVLDDNQFVRMQIVTFLRDAGYTVLEAGDVESGFSLLSENKESVACMLVDVRMEPEDGFAFIQRTKAHDIDIACILVTGDQNHDILSRATQMGVVSVLLKPVIKDRLIMMVQRAIASKRRAP